MSPKTTPSAARTRSCRRFGATVPTSGMAAVVVIGLQGRTPARAAGGGDGSGVYRGGQDRGRKNQKGGAFPPRHRTPIPREQKNRGPGRVAAWFIFFSA